MKIENSVAIVTGANRGLGRQFAAQLLDRGAAKVYAAARRPESIDLPGVEAIGLDVTEPDQVRSEEHTSELQSRFDLVCRLLLEKKKIKDDTERAREAGSR